MYMYIYIYIFFLSCNAVIVTRRRREQEDIHQSPREKCAIVLVTSLPPILLFFLFLLLFQPLAQDVAPRLKSKNGKASSDVEILVANSQASSCISDNHLGASDGRYTMEAALDFALREFR